MVYIHIFGSPSVLPHEMLLKARGLFAGIAAPITYIGPFSSVVQLLNCSTMVNKGKKRLFILANLVPLCAFSSSVTEDCPIVWLRNCIEYKCRDVLQCGCACVLSEHQPEWLNSCTGHT